MMKKLKGGRDPWGFRPEGPQSVDDFQLQKEGISLRKARQLRQSGSDKKAQDEMMDFDDYDNENESELKKENEDKNEASMQRKPYNVNYLEQKRHPELDRIPFSALVKFFREVQLSKGKARKEKAQRMISKFLEISRDPAFTFTIIRLIIPLYDKTRSTYGMNNAKLAHILGDVFSLGEDARHRLRFYKRPNAFGQTTTGDFGEVVQDVLKNLTTSNSLSINTIDKTLDELARVSSIDKSLKVNVLRGIFKFSSAEEIKWVCRLILKELGLGMSHEMILEMFHPDANMLFNMTSSLWVVCCECTDLTLRQSNTLRLFHPIKPMLAGRKFLKTIEQVLTGKDFIVETKYDGERIQCHLTPNEIMFFTRNSNNYTNIYHKMVAPVRRCIKMTIDSCILDGEMIVVNRVTGCAIQFGKNKTIALEREEDDDLTICYKVFDVLYLKTKEANEFHLMNYTLRDRKKILKEVIDVEPNKVETIMGREHSEVAEILVEFNDAVQSNEEGIVVKQMDALYYPGDRSDKWIKMKGDYYEGIIDTLDLLIIGAYFGAGKQFRNNITADWTDHLTHFLVAVSKRIDRNNPMNSVFVPFARVATGFRERDLADIRIKMRECWVRSTQSKRLPSFIADNWRPSDRDCPEAYVNNPKNSLILEVKATEIIQSATYPTNFTLRFPRFEKLRRDKDWNECMKLSELLEMTATLTKKTAVGSEEEGEGGADKEDENGNIPVKRKKKKGEVTDLVGVKKIKKTAGGRENRVMAQFEDTDISNVTVISSLFNRMIFNIINLFEEDSLTPEELSEQKTNIEIDIAKNGGRKVQNDSEIVTHYVAGYYDFRVKAIADFYKVNVLSLSWLSDCINKRKLFDYCPRYLIYAQPELIERNNLLYDKYGDSYFLEVEVEELAEILDQMVLNQQEIDSIDQQELYDIQQMCQIQTNGIYSNQIFCLFNQITSINPQVQALKLIIQSAGGRVVFELQEDITYIVALDYQEQENQDIQLFLESNHEIQIISAETIQRDVNSSRSQK